MHKSPLTTEHCGLRLSAHVRACAIDHQVILLDLRANRYVGIGGAASAALAERVEGWPAQASASVPLFKDTAPDKLAQHLVSQGLLTDCEQEPFRACVVARAPDEPTASLDLADITLQSTAGAPRLAGFLTCAVRTAWWLRSRSLQSIATIISSRRARSNVKTDAGELAHLKQCAAVYERLRPLLLTAQERCLFDSLALTNFLATEGLFPQWIIGVKTAPFGAHSWVQAGSTVLNDQHDYVRRFRPILVA